MILEKAYITSNLVNNNMKKYLYICIEQRYPILKLFWSIRLSIHSADCVRHSMLMFNEWVNSVEAVDGQKVPRAQRVTRVNESLSTSPVNNEMPRYVLDLLLH